jgi:hypothetical protein
VTPAYGMVLVNLFEDAFEHTFNMAMLKLSDVETCNQRDRNGDVQKAGRSKPLFRGHVVVPLAMDEDNDFSLVFE